MIIPYYYGPYSEDLAGTLDFLVSLRIEPTPPGGGFKNMQNSQWHVAGRRWTWIYQS